MTTAPHPFEQILAQAGSRLQAGDLAGMEAALAPFFAPGQITPAPALNMLGVARLKQGRFVEAENLFLKARAAVPGEPMLAFNVGRALAGQGRAADAIAAFRAALSLRPDFPEALYEMGSLLHQRGQLAEAEAAFRQLLQHAPGHAPASLMLGNVLIDAGRPAEAEAPLRAGLGTAREPGLKAVLHSNLGLALRRQRRDADALDQYDSARALNPALPDIDLHRAETLQNLKRYNEALAVFESAIAREPRNPALHQYYNDLLYRLDRKDDFLASYDRAPPTRELQLAKAWFLASAKRGEEAHAIYSDLLKTDPADRIAATGAANTLTMMKRHGDAMQVFETLLARHGGDTEIIGSAAEAALLAGDPARAVTLCEQGLALDPADQMCLAAMGTAFRLMEDERDETLNGYDTLIQSVDLDPPEGFSDMADFNAALNAYLDGLHPQTREFLNQSLRGGTHTPDQLFGAGHDLIGRLQARIDQAVTRYIAEMKEDARHPFLSRRARGFRYTGSWSSRLRDCGFHVNHIHPQGWISSCFYIAVPDAVRDEQARQGWIKFGEPSLDVPLKNPVRRAIQPAPGRLVLFPSYMWHGTIPFRDSAARTTIAFDLVPQTR